MAPSVVGYLFTIFLEKVSFPEMKNIFQTEIHLLTKDIKKLNDDMGTNIDIVKGATKSNLINIYFDRKEAIKDMDKKIADVQNEIFLLAVSGTDLFQINAPLKNNFKKKVISEHFKEKKCRILILDPFSQAAKERAEVEQPTTEYYDSNIKSDIFRAMTEIDDLKKSNAPIEARFYSQTPIAFILRVDDFLFLEMYHLGHVMESYQLPTESLGCIGRQIPVFLFDSNSNLFERMISHFDQIWKNSEDFITISRLKDHLRKFGRNNQIIKDDLPKYPSRNGKYEDIIRNLK